MAKLGEARILPNYRINEIEESSFGRLTTWFHCCVVKGRLTYLILGAKLDENNRNKGC